MYEFASAVLVANEERGLDPNIVRPGWVALGIFVLMAIALALLMWSFARVSRRARAPWDGEDVESPETSEQADADRA
ncbi:hypothetical protein [Aeromicrobium sp. Leaf350]|uniref:hypothetical protein n=1 Tax=Aeromicrobium sp. Leaf350 TaxID=2876565 RepID=UPI001E32466D|nr:hypothetical protein [Aeromicrobium sp. Leaf350]